MSASQKLYDVGGVMLPRPFKAVRLGHFGLWHTDVLKVLSVYVDVLGFRHTDTVKGPGGEPLVAFSSHNTDHHVLVSMDPRTADPVRRAYYDAGVTVNQISLQVNSLKEVNAAHAFFEERGIKISRIGRDMPGSNWAVYAFDPDGHRVELFYGMEQLGWNGVSKPAAMYRPLPYEVIALPQPAEVTEVAEARAKGIDLMSGVGRDAEGPYDHDLEGIMAQRPFKVSRMGPVRIFVADLEASERFYTEIIGLQKTEEVIYKGHRCVYLRTGYEHHSVALIPVALRAELGLSPETTLMGVGVQVHSYRQLRAARAHILAQPGIAEVTLPHELQPGIDRAFHFTFDGIHVFQVFFQMDNVAPDPRPRVDPGPFDQWPETLEGDGSTYADQLRQGPLA